MASPVVPLAAREQFDPGPLISRLQRLPRVAAAALARRSLAVALPSLELAATLI